MKLKKSACLLLAALSVAGCVTVPERSAAPRPVIAYPSEPEPARFFYERTLVSSADIIAEDKDSSFRRAITGENRAGEGMGKPYGLAAYKGRIYVGDTNLREVLVFDIPKGKFQHIGNEDPGGLAQPFGMAVDAAGNLYVADGKLKRVQVYDGEGKYLRSVGVDQLESKPTGLAVTPDGRRLYVVQTGTVQGDGHQVRVFDGVSGKHLFDIGKRGSKEGEFNLPRDAAVDVARNRLYVVDGGNFRVQVFDLDGKFIKVFGGIGQQTGQFSRPKEVDIDADGNVYVVDTAFGNFQIFNSDGQLLLNVGGRSEKNVAGKFMLPSGIAVDQDGRVYMVDQFHRKIEVFRPAALPEDKGFAVRTPAAAAKK